MSIVKETRICLTVFTFLMECPRCGKIIHGADGYETDDWTEVFVFSGLSPQNVRYRWDGPSCPKCHQFIDINMAFNNRLFFPTSIDRVKEYLLRMLPYVFEHRGIYDHGWDPDVETAVNRYASLYPDDHQFQHIKHLYYCAFHNPRALTKLEPSPGTRIIRQDMVLCPDLLQKVYLPNGLTEIGDYAFSSCSKLKDLFLPETVQRVGVSAFDNCTSLRTIHTSDNLQVIGDRAFAGCINLEKLFFPDGVEEIGDQSFSHCYRLKEVFIPAGCGRIGKDAFTDCRDIVLHGKPGSAAENYAIFNHLAFIEEA